jgi:hypothetical protein
METTLEDRLQGAVVKEVGIDEEGIHLVLTNGLIVILLFAPDYGVFESRTLQ